MAKRTIKINIKLPSGVVATQELADKATKAANDAVASAVNETAEVQKLAKELAGKGIHISAQELLERKVSKKQAGSKAAADQPRKRVVLSAPQKKALIADLQAGAKIAAAAEKYGISTATVMKYKTEAGLTKSRKK